MANNVLFIMADEHQQKASGCYGHSFVKTPNIDKLAASGTRFTNAYTNSPICVPARASFATGREVHETGYWDNALAYDGRIEGWGHAMQKAGMHCLSIGKLHYRGEEDPTGFDEQIVPLQHPEWQGQRLRVRQAAAGPADQEKQAGDRYRPWRFWLYPLRPVDYG